MASGLYGLFGDHVLVVKGKGIDTVLRLLLLMVDYFVRDPIMSIKTVAQVNLSLILSSYN